MKRKEKPLNVISDLSKDEQAELYHLMLDHHKTYEEIAALIFERHGKRVSKNTVARHFHRCREDEDTEALPEIKESADAWLHYKETGETTRFDEAALERLKFRTFELSGTLKDQKEFTQLKSLFAILFAARHAAVRERIAAVQERAITLRETEVKARSEREEKKAARTNKNETRAPRLSDPDDTEDTEPMPESDAASRVIKHCSGASGFIGQLLPGEPVAHCMKRLYKAMVAGTLPPHTKPIDWGDDEVGLPRVSTLNPAPASTTEPQSGVSVPLSTPDAPSDPSDQSGAPNFPPKDIPPPTESLSDDLAGWPAVVICEPAKQPHGL